MSLVNVVRRNSRVQRNLTEYVRSILNKIVIIYGKPKTGKTTFSVRLARLLKKIYGRPVKYFLTDMYVFDTDMEEFIKQAGEVDLTRVRYHWDLARNLRNLNAAKFSGVIVDSISSLYSTIGYGLAKTADRLNFVNTIVSIALEKIKYAGLPIVILIFHRTKIIMDEPFFGESDRPNISETFLMNVPVVLKTLTKINETKTGINIQYLIKYVYYWTSPLAEKNYTWYELTQDEFLGQKWEEFLKEVSQKIGEEVG